MTRVLIDMLGWIGAASLLSAYALVSNGRLRGSGLGFQLLNLVGAIGLLVNGVYHGAWPSAGLNTVWLVVGIVALTRCGRPGRSRRPNAEQVTQTRCARRHTGAVTKASGLRSVMAGLLFVKGPDPKSGPASQKGSDRSCQCDR